MPENENILPQGLLDATNDIEYKLDTVVMGLTSATYPTPNSQRAKYAASKLNAAFEKGASQDTLQKLMGTLEVELQWERKSLQKTPANLRQLIPYEIAMEGIEKLKKRFGSPLSVQETKEWLRTNDPLPLIILDTKEREPVREKIMRLLSSAIANNSDAVEIAKNYLTVKDMAQMDALHDLKNKQPEMATRRYRKELKNLTAQYVRMMEEYRKPLVVCMAISDHVQKEIARVWK